MRVAYFDCFSGVSGDMLVGAMLDAGVKLSELERALRPLGLRGFRIAAKKTRRCGLSSTKFDVIETGAPSGKGRRGTGVPPVKNHGQDAHATSRGGGHLREHEDHHAGPFGGSPRKMLAFVKKSRLAAPVNTAALHVLRRIVAAEAAVHGCRTGDVYLHELAGIDTIVDVVGGLCCLRLLGIERFYVSPLPMGSGTIKCAHGLLPLPAPTTMALMQGLPVVPADARHELVTPTGAAFVATLASGFGSCPEMKMESVGYGAGSFDPPDRPNLLRVVVGKQAPEGETDTVLVFETNIDNMTGEEIGYAFERFFAAGALDVYAIPLVMKKSRPGVMLGVIAPVALRHRIETLFFKETRTLGVRCSLVSRVKALRRVKEVQTPCGRIRMKQGRFRDVVMPPSAEYEDRRAAALKHGVSLWRGFAGLGKA